MEYCSAGSLSDIMRICNRTFSEAQVAAIMRHALMGLAYLHGQKKIHRDIKGGNILVDDKCVAKLADFGVSSNLDKTLGKNRTVIGEEEGEGRGGEGGSAAAVLLCVCVPLHVFLTTAYFFSPSAHAPSSL